MPNGLAPAFRPLEPSDVPKPPLRLGVLIFADARDRQFPTEASPVAVVLLLPPDHGDRGAPVLTGTEPAARPFTRRKAKLEVTAMATGKRELIDTGTDKRYVRRDEKGRFDEVVDVGRSLSQDRKRKAEHASKPGHGDRGDRKS